MQLFRFKSNKQGENWYVNPEVLGSSLGLVNLPLPIFQIISFLVRCLGFNPDLCHPNPTSLVTGVSGDKIEIDPVSQPKTTAAKFWSSKQKAVSIDTDRLAACAITDEKPSGKQR